MAEAPAIPPEGAVSPPSDDVPVPQPRPDKEPDTQGPSIPPKTGPALPDPRSAAQPDENMPEDELACRRRLKALGVAFEERKAEHDATVGCSIPYPLELKSLGGSIALSPDAEMNCAMAEATARFAAETISPAAEAEFGSPLKSIDQASAYVCRPRHNGRKISEHAFGNALDIARFRLVDGTAIDVGHGQIHPDLAGDPRVTVIEGLNARDLTPEDLGGRLPDFIVSDVSFISLKLALPPALALARAGAKAVLLVKPQFEAGREAIGKGGLLRNPADAERLAEDLRAWLDGVPGWRAIGFCASPIDGGDGNREFLLGGEKTR